MMALLTTPGFQLKEAARLDGGRRKGGSGWEFWQGGWFLEKWEKKEFRAAAEKEKSEREKG